MPYSIANTYHQLKNVCIRIIHKKKIKLTNCVINCSCEICRCEGIVRQKNDLDRKKGIVDAPLSIYHERINSKKITWPKMKKISDNSKNNKVYPLSVLRLQGFVVEDRSHSSSISSSHSSYSTTNTDNQSIIDSSKQGLSRNSSTEKRHESSKLVVYSLVSQKSTFQSNYTSKLSQPTSSFRNQFNLEPLVEDLSYGN